MNLSTELGGGGTVGLDALAVGDDGTRRWLAHFGILEPDHAPAAASTRYLRTRDRDDFVAAPMDGLFEPRVGLGDEVKAGDVAGIVHPVDDPERDSAEVRFSAAGSRGVPPGPGASGSRRLPVPRRRVRRRERSARLGRGGMNQWRVYR